MKEPIEERTSPGLVRTPVPQRAALNALLAAASVEALSSFIALSMFATLKIPKTRPLRPPELT